MPLEEVKSIIHERDGKNYTIKVLYNNDDDTLRYEYILDEDVVYYLDQESPVDEPDKDVENQSLIDGFDYWYDVVVVGAE